MAWIEVHQSLMTHRKTMRLCRLLKMDNFAVCGRLQALWCWALDNAPDGVIAWADLESLPGVMGWKGEPQKLIDALLESGFVDRSDGESGLLIHDWDDYAGKLIDHRKANADRQRAWRERRKSDTEDDSNTSRNANITVTSPSRNGATVPNRTQPNTTVPSNSSVVSDINHRSSSNKPAPAGKPGSRAPARSPTTTPELKHTEKARWITDVPEDIGASWSVQDRREALDKMLVWCKEKGYPPSEMRYHNWLRNEKKHVSENASDVEKLEAILATYDKETGKCSNGQTYTNNLGKLREAREREQASRSRQQQRAAVGETSLVLLE